MIVFRGVNYITMLKILICRSSNTSIEGQRLVEQVVRIERPGIGILDKDDDDGIVS